MLAHLFPVLVIRNLEQRDADGMIESIFAYLILSLFIYFPNIRYFQSIVPFQIIMIDEPNGNDVISPRRTTTATTSAINTNAATASIPASYSNDDLSLSLSEYTDADESMSAPTEFLAEVLNTRFFCVFLYR